MLTKELADFIKKLRTLLKGQALSYFEHPLRRTLDAEDAELPDNDLLELVISDIRLQNISKLAISLQQGDCFVKPFRY